MTMLWGSQSHLAPPGRAHYLSLFPSNAGTPPALPSPYLTGIILLAAAGTLCAWRAHTGMVAAARRIL